jgi:hypothetical protein
MVLRITKTRLQGFLKAYFNIALSTAFVGKKPSSLALKSLLNKPNLSIIRDSFKVVKV